MSHVTFTNDGSNDDNSGVKVKITTNAINKKYAILIELPLYCISAGKLVYNNHVESPPPHFLYCQSHTAGVSEDIKTLLLSHMQLIPSL